MKQSKAKKAQDTTNDDDIDEGFVSNGSSNHTSGSGLVPPHVPEVVVSPAAAETADEKIEHHSVEFTAPTLVSDPVHVRSSEALDQQAKAIVQFVILEIQDELGEEEGVSIELV